MFHVDDYERLQPLIDENAELRHRPVASESWGRPGWAEVDREGRMVLWTAFRPGARKEPSPVTAARGMLEQFIALDDAPAADCARYARRWGVLHLCQAHALPASHCHPPIVTTDHQRVAALLPAGRRMPDADCAIFAEPIARWREYARRAKAIVCFGAAILKKKRPALADIETLVSPRWRDVISRDRDLQGGHVVEQINGWLSLGRVAPSVSWGARPSITLNSSLFGALGLQLIVATGDFSGMGTCHHCGQTYPAVRRPKRRQRSFCPNCREAGEPARYALDDFRARKRKAEREV